VSLSWIGVDSRESSLPASYRQLSILALQLPDQSHLGISVIVPPKTFNGFSFCIGWLGLVGLLLPLVGCGKPPAPVERPPAPVRVAPVSREEVVRQVRLVGTVVPITTSVVAAAAAGQVIAYPFREGASVKQGDVLARLRSVTLTIQLEAARATEREKEASYQELAAGYRQEEQQQARAAAARAEVEHQYAVARLARTRDAHRSGAVTEDELDQASNAVKKAKHAYAEARALADWKTAGYRAEEIAQAKAIYAAQHQQVRQLEEEMDKRTIRAPFAGYLVRRHSDIGEWIELGGGVATLVDLSQVDVVVKVEESLISMVQLGQQVDVLVAALHGTPFRGMVQHLVPQSQWQAGSHSYPVKVRVKNVNDDDALPLLKEGMLAQVVFHGDRHTALLVRKDAIVRSSGHAVVFRVGDDGRVEPIPVTERHSYGDSIEVDAPLAPGDRLVIEGNERLRPAQQVRILADVVEEAASTGQGDQLGMRDDGTALPAAPASTQSQPPATLVGAVAPNRHAPRR
jgi:RND family efflux transporter MFP subunit